MASNEVLRDVGRDYSNCGTVGQAGALKMKSASFSPLLSRYISRKPLLYILHVKECFISVSESQNEMYLRAETHVQVLYELCY